jgi:hypothetical protein
VDPYLANRAAKEGSNWLAGAVKKSVTGALNSLWRTFWSGSIMGFIAVTVLFVIAVSFVLSNLGLSHAEQHNVKQSVYSVLVAAFLLRLLLYVILGDRSKR